MNGDDQVTTSKQESRKSAAAPWLEHRTVWRWHFYAGLFCIPFVTFLSITGSVYLFKPQIEAWLDKPYDHLPVTGPRASGEAQVRAALAAVPGSGLHDYELPAAADSAVRIIVGRGADEFRVYVHPQTLRILNVVNEDARPMRILFHLHGELLAGDRGSLLVELAASWAMVMIVTGLILWWPRGPWRMAGTVYPRLSQGGRVFWKDLHSVTGLWISGFVLFLLFTGLPWAKNWGGYLKRVRKSTSASDMKLDWTTGRSSEIAMRMAKNPAASTGGGGEHASHFRRRTGSPVGVSYAPVDLLAGTVAPLNLAYPVLLSPPVSAGGIWTARSDAGNRTLRVNLDLDPATGKVLKRENFDQRPWIDRAVGVGVAAHEGQLFPFNQVFNIVTALGLNILNISAIMMWWRRRPHGVLGAPVALPQRSFPKWLLAPIVLLSIWLPLLGASIILVALSERLVLRRIPAASRWLGLAAT